MQLCIVIVFTGNKIIPNEHALVIISFILSSFEANYKELSYKAISAANVKPKIILKGIANVSFIGYHYFYNKVLLMLN